MLKQTIQNIKPEKFSLTKGNWGIGSLRIPEVWQYSKGEGIKIAILDTGFAIGHKDLRKSVVLAKDFTGSEVGVNDINGHGTHIAGIIACTHYNIGVAPASKLYIGKVISDSGVSSEVTLARGIRWALQEEVDIICISLTTASNNPVLEAAIAAAADQNCTVVCAAGNKGPWENAVGYPAKYATTIAVGAVDRNLKLKANSSQGEEVDIVAPGDDIRSTVMPNGYSNKSGTSMAAAFVAGIVALKKGRLKQEGLCCTAEKIKETLLMTATGLGDTIHSPAFGRGLVNPLAFLLPNILTTKHDYETKTKIVFTGTG